MPPNYKSLHAEAIGISPDATDDQALIAHAAHMQAVANEMDDDMPPGPAEVETDNEKKTLTDPTETDRKLQLAYDQALAARQETIALLLTNALASGKITQSDKPAWTAKFESNYESAKTALANEKPKLKTTPRTVALGRTNSTALANEEERRARVLALVNEKKKELNTDDYNLAFHAVQKDPQNTALFEAMKKPSLIPA